MVIRIRNVWPRPRRSSWASTGCWSFGRRAAQESAVVARIGRAAKAAKKTAALLKAPQRLSDIASLDNVLLARRRTGEPLQRTHRSIGAEGDPRHDSAGVGVDRCPRVLSGAHLPASHAGRGGRRGPGGVSSVRIRALHAEQAAAQIRGAVPRGDRSAVARPAGGTCADDRPEHGGRGAAGSHRAGVPDSCTTSRTSGCRCSQALRNFADRVRVPGCAVLRHRRADAEGVGRKPFRGSRQSRGDYPRSVQGQASGAGHFCARPHHRVGAVGTADVAWRCSSPSVTRRNTPPSTVIRSGCR